MNIQEFRNYVNMFSVQNPKLSNQKPNSGETTKMESEIKTDNNATKDAQEAGNTPYENSITITKGYKTNFSFEVDSKIYYYKSAMDLMMAKLSDNPSKISVGEGDIQTQWGEKTEFCINNGEYKLYFVSRKDFFKAKYLNKNEMLKLAVGRYPVENIGGRDVKNNDDAVTNLEGEKTEFYIDDKNGNRYYYKNEEDMMNAALSTEIVSNSCGKAEAMTVWGTESDYYIDRNGKRYYFATENDKQTAEQQLQEDSSIWGMLKFNKLIIGKGNISTE